MSKRKTKTGRDLTCILCKHFYLNSGSPGYSDMTPGWNMEIGCSKNHWDVDNEDITHAEFRVMMVSAQTCEDFEWYEEDES